MTVELSISLQTKANEYIEWFYTEVLPQDNALS
jgi:hypothetical protein